MRKIASIALIAAAASLSAQSLKAYLPAAQASQAASYLASIDADNSAIRSARAAMRAEQTEAESAALKAFALLSAAESGEIWADPDGSLVSHGAVTAFFEARSSALSAARALATGSASAKNAGTAELERKQAEVAEKVRALLANQQLSAKNAAGIEAALSDRAKSAVRLFPEIGGVQFFLRKAGVAGLRLSMAAAIEGRDELVAAALVSRTNAVLAVAPAAASAMTGLAEAYGAYTAWVAGFPLAAYPGELDSLVEKEPGSLSKGIAAMAALGPSRAAALLSSMEAGDGRDVAAAAAARRLAATWESLGAAGKRKLAYDCSVSVAKLAAFSSALAPRIQRDPGKAAPDSLEMLKSLNALAVAIADSGEKQAHFGPEPALLLLQRPDLAAAARAETRYASLYAECRRRIDAAYRKASIDTAAVLESSAQVKKAAAAALGSTPVSIAVETVDIGPLESPLGRLLAFIAVAKAQDGKLIRFPIKPELAVETYARSFSKATGIGISALTASVQKFLDEYHQALFAAYDPVNAMDRLAISVFPKNVETRLLSAIDIEREMLEGWRP